MKEDMNSLHDVIKTLNKKLNDNQDVSAKSFDELIQTWEDEIIKYPQLENYIKNHYDSSKNLEKEEIEQHITNFKSSMEEQKIKFYEIFVYSQIAISILENEKITRDADEDTTQDYKINEVPTLGSDTQSSDTSNRKQRL